VLTKWTQAKGSEKRDNPNNKGYKKDEDTKNYTGNFGSHFDGLRIRATG